MNGILKAGEDHVITNSGTNKVTSTADGERFSERIFGTTLSTEQI